jgi:uncharacterized lipoprotein
MFIRQDKRGILMRKLYPTIGIITFYLFAGTVGWAEEAPKTAEKGDPAPVSVPEEIFPGKLDNVWENLVEVLKNYDFPVANSDKSAGTLNTITRRYFKILSAKFPPVEHDYRDSYAIKVIPGESSTKVQIQRKFETYDNNTKNWIEADPAKEKAGLSVEGIFEALRLRLAQTKNP